jgi:hypothetical protein
MERSYSSSLKRCVYMSNVFLLLFLFCIHVRARAINVSFGDLKNDTRLGDCLTQLLLLICISV